LVGNTLHEKLGTIIGVEKLVSNDLDRRKRSTGYERDEKGKEKDRRYHFEHDSWTIGKYSE
jgi:hypothetical protein